MGWLQDLVNVALYQLGIKFLIPTFAIAVVVWWATKRVYLSIFLGVIGGLIVWLLTQGLAL